MAPVLRPCPLEGGDSITDVFVSDGTTGAMLVLDAVVEVLVAVLVDVLPGLLVVVVVFGGALVDVEVVSVAGVSSVPHW